MRNVMSIEKLENVIVTIIGCAAKAFVIIMAAIVAFLGIVSFCSIFTYAGALGVFGTVASVIVSSTLWGISKEIKVFSHER